MSSSSRRPRPRRAGMLRSLSSPPPSRSMSEEDQISDLLSKLQALLPEPARARHGARRGSSSSTTATATAAAVLQEACSYIRGLWQEADALSETLSGMLADDVSGEQAAAIRSLLLL